METGCTLWQNQQVAAARPCKNVHLPVHFVNYNSLKIITILIYSVSIYFGALNVRSAIALQGGDTPPSGMYIRLHAPEH